MIILTTHPFVHIECIFKIKNVKILPSYVRLIRKFYILHVHLVNLTKMSAYQIKTEKVGRDTNQNGDVFFTTSMNCINDKNNLTSSYVYNLLLYTI